MRAFFCLGGNAVAPPVPLDIPLIPPLLGDMADTKAFVAIIKSEFPDDRLTFQKGIPAFHPENSGEAALLFKLAAKHGGRLFISGFGNNIDPQGGPYQGLLLVKTDRLNKLIEINAKDLYLKVGSGYPLQEINKAVKQTCLWLPHSALPYAGSVGGAIAAGLDAELHEHSLPLKQYFLQAEIVTPDGEIITPGSICFKSVSGYDVVKIFFGSWGLLGLIVSASLRLMPETGKADYAELRQKSLTRHGLVKALRSPEGSDAGYSKKIKAKFDPHDLLPVV